MGGGMTTTSLVTGGAGFIGRHLVGALVSAGERVIILDNLSGLEPGAAGPQACSLVETVLGDCKDHALVNSLVRRSDRVFHMAAIVGVRRVLSDPAGVLRDNHAMTEAVLDACRLHGRPLIMASSSEVYGKGVSQPMKETDDLRLGEPGRGRWAYAVGKLASEHLALGMARGEGLKVTVARLFNTTGRGQTGRYGMVVPTFVDQALRGEPITIIGDGSQTRCFVHVEDVVRALLVLATIKDPRGLVVNVGSETAVTIQKLAHRVLDICGSRSPIVYIEPETLGLDFEEIQDRRPDVSRLKALTHWTPLHSLDDIIRDVAGQISS